MNNIENKKQLFIRGDLNALDKSTLPLKNQVWLSLLKKEYGTLREGLKIWLYEELSKNNVIIFPGILKNTRKDGEYEVLVDEKDFQTLAESKEFNGYSVEDVINSKRFTEEYENIFLKIKEK